MLCLGIETSCDETALALVEDGRLLDETLASQSSLHAIFGGVVPELASREHYRFIGALFDELLRRNNLRPQAIDYIAVARGPGLLGSLLVGVAFAKGLALGLGRPLLGINHLHAHLLAAGLENSLEFPAIGLVASGGHTHLYRMNNPSDIRRLGRSLDDAAGEIFDKVGHALGFPYPAGKFIDQCGADGCADAFALPRPYLDNNSLDFSFSGLKTAALLEMKAAGVSMGAGNPENGEKLADFCASFNMAIADTLAVKLARALDKESAKQVIFAGGVAANRMIRERLKDVTMKYGAVFIAPSFRHCTDNAAMCAYAGWLLGKMGYYHGHAFEAVPRGREIPDDTLFKTPI